MKKLTKAQRNALAYAAAVEQGVSMDVLHAWGLYPPGLAARANLSIAGLTQGRTVTEAGYKALGS
jgi:hypothetical protein